jgi:hypothetical protein
VGSGFSAQFQFRISNNVNGGADGLAFVIQHSPAGASALGEAGGGIGYSGMPNSLAIEFDTWQNEWDSTGNHVGFQSCGTSPNSTALTCLLATGGSPVTLEDGAIHTANITYAGGMLGLSLDGGLLVMSTAFDLGTLGLSGGSAYVGFTAGTGWASSYHDIGSWSFNSIPEPTTWALVGLGLLAVGIWGRRRNR